MVVGYIGAALLAASYLVPTRLLLPVQAAATAAMMVYAVAINELPLVFAQAAIAAAMAMRLVCHPNMTDVARLEEELAESRDAALVLAKTAEQCAVELDQYKQLMGWRH